MNHLHFNRDSAKKWLLVLFILCTVFLAYKVKNPSKGRYTHDDHATEHDTFSLEKKEAPNFYLKDLEGISHNLIQYKGKWVVLNFFATWCPPCREEMPDFVDYSEKHKEIVFLGINLEEPLEKVRSFAQNYKISFPVLLDSDGKISELYKVRAIPVTVIIDPEGKIKDISVGRISAKWHFDREIYGKEPK